MALCINPKSKIYEYVSKITNSIAKTELILDEKYIETPIPLHIGEDLYKHYNLLTKDNKIKQFPLKEGKEMSKTLSQGNPYFRTELRLNTDNSQRIFILLRAQKDFYTDQGTLFQLEDNTPNQNNLQEGLEWLKKVYPNTKYEIIEGLINDIGKGSYNTITDLITLSKEYADKGTIKHELGHSIFNKLPKEQQEALLEEGSKLFNLSIENKIDIEEGIMKLLETSEDFKEPSNIIEQFINWLKSLLRKVYDNRNILEAFIEDVNSGVYRDLKFLPEDQQEKILYQLQENYNIQQETDIIAKEIQDKLDKDNKLKENIVNLVDDYFDRMSNHLNNLLKNKNYSRLRNIFTGEHGVLKITSITDLLRRTKELQESIETDKKRVSAIAKSIKQIDYLSDFILEDVQSIVESSEESPVVLIKTLQSYLNVINDWKVLVADTLILSKSKSPLRNILAQLSGKIEDIEKLISQNNESAIVDSLKDILTPQGKEYMNVLEDYIKDKEKKLSLTTNPKLKESLKRDIKGIKEIQEKYNFEEGKNIIGFLKGLPGYGDSGFFNSIVEKFSNSSDPIISSFRKYVHDIQNSTATKSIQWSDKFIKEVLPLVTQAERFDPKKVNERISFEDTILNSKGEKEKIITLLNEWKDYRYDYQSLVKEEQELKNEYLSTKTKENQDNYEKARLKRQEFEKNVLYQENSPKYYDKFSLLKDDVGLSLKEDIDNIFDQINEIQEKYYSREEELTPEDLETIDGLWREYKLLGNVNYANGTPKEDFQLNKALRMREIRALNQEVYNFTDNWVMFEKAKENYIEFLHTTLNLQKDSPEFIQLFKDWEDKNTRVVVTDQYYKDVENLFLELQYLLSKTKNPELEEDIQKQYKIVKDLIYGNKDEDNQPIGTLFQPKASERIKAAQEAIEELRFKAKQLGNLTTEQYDRLQELASYLEDNSLTPEEQIEMNELEQLQRIPNLSKTQSETLQNLLEKLAEIQSKLPTEYYVEVFNNIASQYGITIQDDGTLKESEIDILKSPELNSLLIHSDFKEWFEKNHYQAREWNKGLKEYEDVWKRTPQWTITKPNDQKYYEVRPSRKYSKREIKPEYKTGYNPQTKEVELKVGVHIDNKGNFLPDPSKEGSKQYKNEKYHQLINSKSTDDERLVKLLNIYKEHLLEAQEEQSYQNKLYLDIPGVVKSSRESLLSTLKRLISDPKNLSKEVIAYLKGLWEKIVSFDYNDIDYEDQVSKFQRDFTKIPMKFKNALPSDIASYDFFKSISKYYYSAELHNSLKEALPLAKAIVKESDKASIQHNTKNSNRNRAIRRIFEADFEGKTSGIELGDNHALKQLVGTTLRTLTGSAAWMYMKLSPTSTIANLVEARISNLIKAFGTNMFTPRDLALANKSLHSTYLWKWILDYIKNDPTNLSLETQLFQLFSPIIGESTIENLGESYSNSTIANLATLQPLQHNRALSEIYAQSSMWLAIMKAIKVEQITPQGKIDLNLEDAYELGPNNTIKLKEGISKDWDFQGQKFLDIKTKTQRLLEETHGASSQDDKSYLDASFTANFLLFLKKFLIEKVSDAFATNISFDRKTFRLKNDVALPSFNLHKGARIGYTSQTIVSIIKVLNDKILYNTINKPTKLEQQAIFQQIAKLTSIILPIVLIKLIWGYGGDDDKEKKKILKNLSNLDNNLLYFMKRMSVEQASIYKIKTYKEYLTDITSLEGFSQWKKTLEYLLSGEEYENTQRSPSGTIIIREGDKKWKIYFRKVIGIKGAQDFLKDPDYVIREYEKNLRRDN